MDTDIIIRVNELKKHFPVKTGWLGFGKSSIKAVDGVTFAVKKGETFGLVGESGCGKSTTARLILKLQEPTAGQIWYQDQEITHLDHHRIRPIRRNIQMIFQDPYASLNPRFTVGQIIMEPLIIHNLYTVAERKEKVYDLLNLVGLSPYHAVRYPHEFSGGQRQRIGIARALAVDPELIICDEPVSALDVSIQAQVLNLMQDLQEQLNLTYLFIAHDLSVVKHISDRIGVMYLGRLVETASRDRLYRHPLHPYTQALFSAAPIPDPRRKRKSIVLTGDIPSPANPPTGCAFHTRCVHRMEQCRAERPQLRLVGEDHYSACFLKQTDSL